VWGVEDRFFPNRQSSMHMVDCCNLWRHLSNIVLAKILNVKKYIIKSGEYEGVLKMMK